MNSRRLYHLINEIMPWSHPGNEDTQKKPEKCKKLDTLTISSVIVIHAILIPQNHITL